jgi:tRNA (guanine-N7-)-methyltransferase
MAQRKRSAIELKVDAAADPYLLDPAGPLDWPALFGNSNGVEIEVGSGKGLFLITAAAERPKTNFLGIEIARKYAAFIADRALRRGLTNVRVACADARRVLSEGVAASSVQAVHVYFPDPWWKRRHKKRRVFTDAFVRDAARVLVPGGELRLASDVEEYFQLMCELVTASGSFTPKELPLDREPQHDLDYLTNFERKYRKQGRPVFRAVFGKRV